jgi:hypothetical protein
MPESRENLLQMIEKVQSVNDRHRELFEICDKEYRAMRPELQDLSNRVVELALDEELKRRVLLWKNSDEHKRYKSAVDRIFAEAFPAYGNVFDILGEHVDQIWADPLLSEKYAPVAATLRKFREQHRELTTLVNSLTPVWRNFGTGNRHRGRARLSNCT